MVVVTHEMGFEGDCHGSSSWIRKDFGGRDSDAVSNHPRIPEQRNSFQGFMRKNGLISKSNLFVFRKHFGGNGRRQS